MNNNNSTQVLKITLSTKDSLHTFLNKYHVEKGSEFTHTSMQPPGCYYIPGEKLEQFYNIYSKTILKNSLTITEKHRDISPILIDFDFRQSDIICRYTKSQIIEISYTLIDFIKDYVDIPNTIEIFILSKPPRECEKSKGCFKDGIHIIIPSIVTKPEYQYIMRDATMQKIDDILKLNNYSNDIKDIYDKAVIEKNNWFLYGSKKPMNDPHPWKVDHILQWQNDSIVEIENNYTLNELVETLSIRNKYEENIIIKKINKPKKVIIEPITMSSNLDNYEYIKSLVLILNKDRADNYQDWISLGWCLHTICENLLDIWIEFSMQSSKYNDGECEKLWINMKIQGLNIGTLHFWAKQDDPYAYKEILSKSIYQDIKNCDGSHGSVADIAFKILKHKYVCAMADGKCWYIFNGSLWKIDNSQLKLRTDLSTIVRDQYLQIMNKIASTQTIDDMQSNRSTSTTVDKIKKDCERLLKIAFKLRDVSFIEMLIKSMRQSFYDELFLSKLDSNPNLIGFNNGVWSLKEELFRKSTPEDFISLSVGYDYIAEINDEYQNKIIAYFEKLHPHKDQRKYVLQMLARQMYGDSGCELFHVHSGFNASAGNGKSIFFQILELCFRDYILKIPVEIFIIKQRGEAGRPKPELQEWRAKRILYCTEPNSDDKLNSGVLKELTGGEEISYRLLFSNDIQKFRPMYKMSIMCNDAPIIEGGDEGIKRRIRKIDYVSKFVDNDQVNEENHYYVKDPNFVEQFKEDDVIKMEFSRYILNHYNHAYKFEMPDIIKKTSSMYIEENNNILNFVKESIVKDVNGFFTLKDAKEKFKDSQYFNNKLTNLKNELQKILKAECFEQKKFAGNKYRSVFIGYKLNYNENNDSDELEI